jgi:hypothetical protein
MYYSEAPKKSKGTNAMMFNDRRISSKPPRQTGLEPTDPYGLKLPGGLKPRTMGEYTSRANVIAAAKAGSIKSTEPPAKTKKRDTQTGELKTPVAEGKERVFKVNRPMTKALVGKGGGALIGREVDVEVGSRKAGRIKERTAKYEKNYGTLAPYKKGK